MLEPETARMPQRRHDFRSAQEQWMTTMPSPIASTSASARYPFGRFLEWLENRLAPRFAPTEPIPILLAAAT